MSSEKDNNSSQQNSPKDSLPAKENKPTTPEKSESGAIKQEPVSTSSKETSNSEQTVTKDTPDVKDRNDKPNPKNSGSKKPQAGKKSGGIFKVLFFVLLLLVAGGLGYGGYWFYQHRTFFEQDYATDLEQQRELIAGIQRGLEREREARIGLSSQYESQLAAINNGLVAQQNRLTELGGTSRRDWLLAEAEFLMRLANERLVIERDPANALALLQSADQILLDLDDPELISLRKAVARDITALQMVRRVDTQGIYLQLSAITEQVIQLPISPLHRTAGQNESVQSENMDDLVWYQKLWQNFKSAVTNLRGLVRIQQHNQPVKALLAPEQEGVIRATLLLVLEQAQVAILRGDADVYWVSLDKAVQFLKDYFQMTDGAAGLTGQLEQLRQESLVEVYPDISGSLRAIKDYIDLYHARYPVKQESAQ